VLAMVRAGTDESSFAAVYAAHRDRAVGLAYLLVGDHHQAEDVVAEAFTKVYVRWRRGEVRDVGAYVRRAVANEANSRLRRRYLERAVASRRTGDDRGVQLLDEAAAERSVLWSALGQLSQPQRTVLVLRYFEDLSEAETAGLLGCSVGTVKSRAARGIARLEELVGPAAHGRHRTANALEELEESAPTAPTAGRDQNGPPGGRHR
jgi:RNA polymerase sigma-70 factor (sigma-E family)